MEHAQRLIEAWLTQTLGRQIYKTEELIPRMNELLELVTAKDAQQILLGWRDGLTTDNIYSASLIQDTLFNLWGAVAQEIQAIPA